MKLSTFLSIIAWIGGEVLIYFAFTLWCTLEQDILILNMAVSALLYTFLFIDTLVPWIRIKDKSSKDVGVLGLRGLSLTLYLIAAIAVMILCNTVWVCTFNIQLIVHCGLLLCFLFAIIMQVYTGEHIQDVHQAEEQVRRNIVNIRRTAQRLQMALDTANLPPQQTNRLRTLCDNLRYISPSSQAEAQQLEQELDQRIIDLLPMLTSSANAAYIDAQIAQLEGLYQQRKSLYFN